jgi:hypothetical protein
MDVNVEAYEVVCFVCGEVFAAREQEPADAPATLVCPRCGQDLLADPKVRVEGAFSLSGLEDDRDDR